jgi:ferredoxin
MDTTVLARHGLIVRGGFVFAAGQAAPPGPSGRAAKAVLLVGQAGAAPWPHFQRWREKQPEGLANPLDTWSRQVIGEAAQAFGARAVWPSDRPFLPFQQWACRAEGLKPSPLGILMHPEYGLWHAYRGALLFDEEVPELQRSSEAADASIHLCDLCREKPCLGACPVGAHSGADFAYDACLSHVRSPMGKTCRDTGCLARNACPHGAAYRYPKEMQAFHIERFAHGR